MSFYELDRPVSAPSATLLDTVQAKLQGVGAWFARGYASMNESRLRSALYTLDDTHLDMIGITRAEIPAYTRKCLESGK